MFKKGYRIKTDLHDAHATYTLTSKLNQGEFGGSEHTKNNEEQKKRKRREVRKQSVNKVSMCMFAAISI